MSLVCLHLKTNQQQQTANQPTNHPANHPPNQPTNQPTNNDHNIRDICIYISSNDTCH